jgi:ribosomal subunit interface protein
MAFKNITFKHTNSDTDSRIHEFVRQKLVSLEKYVADGVEARVEVEFEKVASHKSGPICRVEVNVWVDGSLYRADNTQETFEAAIDVVKDDLDHEMKKAHKKRNSLFRKGSRKIKEMLRFGR